MMLTIAHFYTPNHHLIAGVGIEPDVTLPMDPRLVGRSNDLQLERATVLASRLQVNVSQ